MTSCTLFAIPIRQQAGLLSADPTHKVLTSVIVTFRGTIACLALFVSLLKKWQTQTQLNIKSLHHHAFIHARPTYNILLEL